jgi:hypothetical protein
MKTILILLSLSPFTALALGDGKLKYLDPKDFEIVVCEAGNQKLEISVVDGECLDSKIYTHGQVTHEASTCGLGYKGVSIEKTILRLTSLKFLSINDQMNKINKRSHTIFFEILDGRYPQGPVLSEYSYDANHNDINYNIYKIAFGDNLFRAKCQIKHSYN